MQIRDRVFGAPVSKEIIKIFKEIAGGGLSGTENAPDHPNLESRNPTFEKYSLAGTPFARMWTAAPMPTARSSEGRIWVGALRTWPVMAMLPIVPETAGKVTTRGRMTPERSDNRTQM